MDDLRGCLAGWLGAGAQEAEFDEHDAAVIKSKRGRRTGASRSFDGCTIFRLIAAKQEHKNVVTHHGELTAKWLALPEEQRAPWNELGRDFQACWRATLLAGRRQAANGVCLCLFLSLRLCLCLCLCLSLSVGF